MTMINWVLIVLSLSGLLQISVSLSLPNYWVCYFDWLEAYFKTNPNSCLPQVLLPNELMLAQNEQGKQYIHLIPFLPPVLIWNPRTQFPTLFGCSMANIPCPSCGQQLHEGNWNTGRHVSAQPRLLYDLSGVVMLIGINYQCSTGHKLLSYDPRILSVFPDNAVIPFSLSHRCGFTSQLMTIILGLVEQGSDFSKVVGLIKQCRSNKINTLIKKSQEITCKLSVAELIPKQLINTIPSRFMLTSVFLQQFFMQKEIVFNHRMRSLSTNDYLTIDHTFKVASNIGYLRSDNKWVTQYNSLFIVLNDIGQVLSWKLTKTETFAEVEPSLIGLRDRLISYGAPAKVIVVDNCCHWSECLRRTFGCDLHVKLDLFHAVQRITRTISNRNRFKSTFLREFRLVFRAPGDVGKQRKLPTPKPLDIASNLQKFIARWKSIGGEGNPIHSHNTIKEMNNLNKHVVKGCLSDIPPGMGTNRNEALHRHINPYFRKTRMGVKVAYALLCLLFFIHNNITSVSNNAEEQKLLPMYHDHSYFKQEHFGILPTVQSDTQFWGTRPTNTSQEAMEDIELALHCDNHDYNDGYLSLDQGRGILLNVLDNAQTHSAIESSFSSSSLLQKKFLPFVLNVSSQLLDTCTGKLEEHDSHLDEIIRICGVRRIKVLGDGNCFFQSAAIGLKQLCASHSLDKFSLPVNVGVSVVELGNSLRHLVIEEWISHLDTYQDFLTETDINQEATKFRTPGFFDSELGNTMAWALSNSLNMPFVMLTSIKETPILTVKPRKLLIPYPLLLAFNQCGAGHYDAIGYSTTIDSMTALKKGCRCGAHKSTTSRCCENPLYTCRCPCYNGGSACTQQCKCQKCCNPYGKHEESVVTPVRKRQRHALQCTGSQINSASFMENRGEQVTHGPWSTIENLIFAEVMSYVQDNHEQTTETVHQIYHELVHIASTLQINLPLGQKDLADVSRKMQQYTTLQETFYKLTNINSKDN